MRVIFTPLAERNINSLHEYIAEHTGEERADGYVGRIVDFCNGLSTFPLRGTQRDDLLSGLRVTGFERRVTIAFIVTADGSAPLTTRVVLYTTWRFHTDSKTSARVYSWLAVFLGTNTGTF